MAGLFWAGAVGLPLIFFVLLGISPGVPIAAVAISICLLVYSATRLASLIGAGQVQIFSGATWLFAYVSMGVVPLAQAHTGLFPFLVDTRYILPAQFMAIVALLAFDLGRLFSRPLGIRVPSGRTPRRLSTSRLKWLTGFSILASVYYISSVGDMSTFFASRRDLASSLVQSGLRTADSQAGSAIVQTLGTVPVFIALLAWILILLRRRSDPPTLGVIVVLLALVAVNAVVNNPISNTRYWVLTIVVGGAYAAPRMTPRFFRVALALGVVAALTVFPYADYFRATEAKRGPLQVRSIGQELSTKDYDQSIMTANGVWWVAGNGHTFGMQLVGDALFWVPRTFWPNKPLDTGLEIGLALNGANANLSSPLWLEFWVDFGWAGMAALLAAVGAATRVADQAFSASLSPDRPHVLATDIALPLLAGFSFILLRGPLLQAMPRLAIVLAACWWLRTSRGARLHGP